MSPTSRSVLVLAVAGLLCLPATAHAGSLADPPPDLPAGVVGEVSALLPEEAAVPDPADLPGSVADVVGAATGPVAGGGDGQDDAATPGAGEAPDPATGSGPEDGGSDAPDDPPSGRVAGGAAAAGSAVCLQLPGADAGAAGDLAVLDEDVFGRLREQAPELERLVAPCPEGARVHDGLAIDLDAGDLGSVCVRLDPAAADPLLADVVLVGTDVLDALTEAGLPLRDLVVPCEGPADGTEDGAATPPDAGADAASRVPTAADAGGRLPYTGGPLGALAAAGLLLVGGGALLRRFAARG